MSGSETKTELLRSLQEARDSVLWKLEGLGEGEVRRPMTPTGTNLLGLVKHLAGVELLYFGFVVNRPFPEPVGWSNPQAEPGSDLWAAPDESRDDLVGLYRRVWAHADAVVAELDLDAPGFVPWWAEETRQTTLRRVLIHVIGESQRHAGHADIVRELIDGTVGRVPGEELRSSPLGPEEHIRRLERIASEAGTAG